MFFKKNKNNKDKKIEHELASYAIIFTDTQMQEINKIAQNIKFTEIESLRLRFCLLVLNLSAIFWWINISERTGVVSTSRSKKIINNVLDIFMNNFKDDRVKVKVGDYIVEDEEINLLGREWGGVNIVRETNTNLSTLISSIYNIRISQYKDAFAERLRSASEVSHGFLDPVAKTFTKHFVGNDSSYYTELVVGMSLLMIPFDGTISNIVRDCIKK